MKILVIGQAAFGQDVFNKLREAGEDVVAVAAPAQSLSGRADRLRAAADEAGVPAFETAKLKDAEVQKELRALEPELGVMVYVSDIIPVDALNLPRHGTIQYHPSLLPKHRGRSSINWSIIQGDPVTGVSIFWPDEGIDTGPILLQREATIDPDDTVSTLYYNKLYPMGIDMILESVKLVREGKAPRIAQDESEATYERPIEDRHVRIDWRKPAPDVYNLIRGADPSPGAWTRIDDRRIKVFDALLEPEGPAGPGVIESISDRGVLICGAGGSFLIRKMQAEGGPQMPANDFASEHRLKAGDRFLNPKPAPAQA
jgi:methionyl-tRNA formyltransferase